MSSPPRDDCPAESQFVYVIDADGMLRRFNPPTGTFSAVAGIDCGKDVGSPFSMAVARDGTAWVLFSGAASSKLFKVSTKDASCSPTSFKAPANWSEFGMGFVSDEADGKTETLYVASVKTGELGKIAVDTLTLTPIGAMPVTTRMEFTGTGSAQLFGLVAPSPFDAGAAAYGPWSIAEISKSSGQFIAQKETGMKEQQNLNFAFAAWGGNFYSFVGSRVYRYDPQVNESTLAASDLLFTIVGAGVSTCAPHAIVN